MAAAAMAAAMAERAAFTIYTKPQIFGSPDPGPQNLARSGSFKSQIRNGPENMSTRRFSRRQSEFLSKRTLHQGISKLGTRFPSILESAII